MQIDKEEMKTIENIIQRKAEAVVAVNMSVAKSECDRAIKKNMELIVSIQKRMEKIEQENSKKFDSIEQKIDEIIYLLKGDGHTVLGVATQADEAYKYYQRLVIKETEKKADIGHEFAKRTKYIWAIIIAGITTAVTTIISEILKK